MEVAAVAMSDGILKVFIIRNVPEEAKPKTFEILDSFTPKEFVTPPVVNKRKK
jgi:hypothetical protein